MSQLGKNISYNLILSIGKIIFPIFSIPYISRVLLPEGLGEVNFIDSLSFYFVSLATVGIPLYGIREVAKIKNNLNELNMLVSSLLSFHIIATILFILVYGIVIFFINEKINNHYLLIFSFIFIFFNSFSCEWYFWGTEKFKYIASRTLLSRTLGLICIFLFVKDTDDYFIYYGIIVGTYLFNIFWNASILFHEIKFQFTLCNWKQLLSRIKVMYAIDIIFSITLMLDSVFLGLIGSVAAVSYYALSAKVVRIVSTVLTDSFYVLYPNSVKELHVKGTDSFKKFINDSFQCICLIAIPLSFGIFLFSDTFTNLYFGSSFKAVSTGIKVLCIYPFLKSISLFIDKQLLMPAHKESKIFHALISSVIIFIPCNIILSFFFSYVGTCISILIAELILIAVSSYYAKKYYPKIRILNYKNLLQIFIGTLLFIPIFYVLKIFISNNFIFLLVTVSICFGCYFTFLYIVKNKYASSIISIAQSFIFKK